MATSSTTFGSETQPARRRGKAFKTLLLESLIEKSKLGLSEDSTKEDAERAFLTHVVDRATDEDNRDSATLLKELLGKSYPSLKASLPPVQFDLPEEATQIEKAEAILKAVSDGNVSPDVGTMLIQATKHLIDIEQATELKERLEAIEKELGINV